MIELWKFLRDRVREDCCKPLHCQRDCVAVASSAVHEQDAASDFAVVFPTAVEAGNSTRPRHRRSFPLRASTHTRHPRCWHRPINGHARFVDGYLAKGLVVAGYFQGNQSTVAVANEQGGARLRLQGEHVLTLFDDAVIIALRAALASSPALNVWTVKCSDRARANAA